MGGAVSPQSESAEGRELTGSGTKENPYQIATAKELREFAKLVNDGKTDAWAVLTADIDLNPGFTFKEDGSYSGPDEEEPHQWTPIGSDSRRYSGTFNGDGHTISGLYIKNTSSDTDYQGLFGYVSGSGEIEYLTVSGSVSVSGGMYVGGIAGRNLGNVINCTFSGSVSGKISVGGVVGYNGGTVENCYNTGSVSGNSVGGVVGYNSGTVENCYNTGSVSGSPVGGVVGYNDEGRVENCYNIGKVSGTGVAGGTDVGGVVGNNDGSVTGCYFLQQGELQGIGDEANATGATVVNDLNALCKALESNITWTIHPVLGRPVLNENKEGGDGSPDSPYEISTATELKNFRDIVNGANDQTVDSDADAKLMNDIDLSSVCSEEKGTWTPIGIISQQYSGTFDGNGKTISGLYIDSSSDNYQGLFGYVYRGTVQNLSVSGSVKGNDYVGGVVGYNNGGTVTGCIFSGSGSVSGVTGSDYVGGIVGYNGTGATVSNCYNTGTVTGNDYVGGVVGQNFGGVENCYNTGTGTVTGNDFVGGVVGQNFGGTVENCYNTRTVSGSDYVGGVVGDNISSVTNCYNTGTVTSSGNSVGGVVGYNYGGRVENCYNTGSVSDGTTSGGVVGQNSGSVTNCYFLQQNGVPAQGIGSGSGTATEKDDTAFHSGEVAWRLQNGQKAAGAGEPIPLVWGQSKLGETTSLPTLNPTDEQKVYQVTFDYGDSFADNDGRHAYSYTNGVVSKPTKNPELDGHTLSGWYSDPSLTTAWDFSTAVTKNMTLYAKWTAVEEPDPDPEPTPEPEPEEPPYTGKYSYELTTSVGDHGSLTVDRYATEGEKVTITVTPDEAYKLDDLSVTAHGKDVELTANGDGTYTFTMPSADVKISATFAEDPDWTEPEPEPSTDVSDLFIDIAPDAWYKDAIQYAYDNGLMTGVSATEFDPEATTTRAMIVSILARLENVTTAQAAGFADVDDNDWYATAVNWAANVGVVNGYEDGTFKPNTAITREQLAAILMNYAAYKGEDVSNRADLTSYTDQPSTWAKEAISWSVAEGLLTGVTADTLQPQGAATRAQVAAILQRFLSE